MCGGSVLSSLGSFQRSSASQASALLKVIALFVKVQSFPAGLPHSSGRGVSLYNQHKSSPLRRLAQMGLICATGCHRMTNGISSVQSPRSLKSQFNPATNTRRQLPPPWSLVDVVVSSVSLEVILHHIAVTLFFDAF